ncbi:hypothetical protein HNV11_16585 [Spirosoma taeanense]|uniref:Uncharacterized protein n=1 Tax=Spirosoma taeanense TaxID=2735870 RepID=A0A6M5Y9E4_9BACT|nr:hypothetical protein [Spirosoma taeanense]QJW90878.1 hypothetical protein HNV11_16585 [Spirosoma taeanense]
MTESLQVNGHTIEIFGSAWNGNEVVKYDGVEVSSRRNITTSLSTHSFTVQEAGENIVYEVQISGGFVGTGYVVRRNGIVQGHKP